MKRTKSINHASFRKSWNARHLTPVALAVTAVFMLAGCEKSDETVSLYQNAEDCSAATGNAAECKTAYNNALKEAERTAPKYATREDCVAEFGEGQCQQTPAQAGTAPENQAQAQSSGSFWMPLMAGYMMGRLMGGGAGYQQQPLFSSKKPGQPGLRPIHRCQRQRLWRSNAWPHRDRTENGDGSETGYHQHHHPRRVR